MTNLRRLSYSVPNLCKNFEPSSLFIYPTKTSFAIPIFFVNAHLGLIETGVMEKKENVKKMNAKITYVICLKRILNKMALH